jgi:hypothetical protein
VLLCDNLLNIPLDITLPLGSVAGHVIQATGRSEFDDGLGSGDFLSGYSYHMSVRTRLPDHTMQIKFQSQRPSYVKTPVPSILSTEVLKAASGQSILGWVTALWVCVHPISRGKADQL